MATSKAAPFPTKPRRNYPRSKSGCLTCRRRKKKCDEDRPRCLGCRRNDLECSWPTSTQGTGPKDGPVQVDGTDKLATNSNAKRGQDFRLVVEFKDECLSPKGGEVPWFGPLGYYISPTRAACLTPQSGTLLQHYQLETAKLIVPAPDNRNPFLSSVLASAYNDDLLMHCLLAMGGAHLGSKNISLNTGIQTATMRHYSCVLRSLRQSFDGVSDWSTSQTLRVLLALILTALFEAISTTSLDGAMFPHLRASRQLILNLMKANQPTTAEEKHIFGFILEGYTYLVLVNIIGPYGMLDGRSIPYDSFLDSIATLSESDTFGIFLAGCHDLFVLIPRISTLASQRLDEAHSVLSENSKRTYNTLHYKINAWEPVKSGGVDNQDDAHRHAIGKVYQHALIIYLEAAMAGYEIEKSGLIVAIEEHIQSIVSLVLGQRLDITFYANILLWPLIMVGSCLLNQQTRDIFARELKAHQSGTWTSIRAIDLLQLLWREHDKDKRYFGPLGLYLTMKKHGMNFCMA